MPVVFISDFGGVRGGFVGGGGRESVVAGSSGGSCMLVVFSICKRSDIRAHTPIPAYK